MLISKFQICVIFINLILTLLADDEMNSEKAVLIVALSKKLKINPNKI